MKLKNIIMIMMAFLVIVSTSTFALEDNKASFDVSIDGCIQLNEKNNETYNAYITVTNNNDQNLKDFSVGFDINDEENNYIWHKYLNWKKIKALNTKTYKKTILLDRNMRFFVFNNENSEMITIDKDSKLCPEPKPEPVKTRSRRKASLTLKYNTYKNVESYSIKTKYINSVTTDNRELKAYSEKYNKTKTSTFRKDSKIQGIKYNTEEKDVSLSIRLTNDGSLSFSQGFNKIPEVELFLDNKWHTFNTSKSYKLIRFSFLE